jgi:hypothetical protein
MKKVLIIFGGAEFSEGAFEFAQKMNEIKPILLVGVFIPQISYVGLWTMAPMAGAEFIALTDDEMMAVKENIERFKNLCLDNNIAYHVHTDYVDFTLADLKLKTRFSDLLIVSSDKFYSNIIGEDPEDYLRDALHTSECPVIVIAEKFDFPTRNIFAYNGGKHCVYAVKHFIYLFPEFSGYPSTFVYAKEDEDAPIPEESDMKEFADAHLPNNKFMKLEIDPKKYFSTWIRDEKYSILIGGVPDRPKITKLFKKSFFQQVISEHLLPVFIAHK